MKKKTLVILIGIVTSILVFFVVFFSIPSNYKNSIQVNQHEIDHFKGDATIANVIVFSDLHLLYDYQVSDLDKLVSTINQQDPDIVIFNGDLFDDKSYQKSRKQNNLIVEKLKEIKPIYGKFALMGEQDFKNDDARSLLVKSDFEIINNKIRRISINNKSFNIIGLSNKINTDLISELSDKKLNMAFIHHPKNIEKITKYKLDVVVASHTLGGQYNIPLYGSIFEDIRKYPLYRGNHEIDGTKVVITNGIGIYQSSMRFLADSSIEQFIVK